MLSCSKSKQAFHGQNIGVVDGQMAAFYHVERSSVVILFFILQEYPQEKKQKTEGFVRVSPHSLLDLNLPIHNDATAPLLHVPG